MRAALPAQALLGDISAALKPSSSHQGRKHVASVDEQVPIAPGNECLALALATLWCAGMNNTVCTVTH